MNDRIPEQPPHIEPVGNGVYRPLISVMIPVYNCYRYIPAVLNSVLTQDPGNDQMQIEIIDDCSTDGDVEALVKEIAGNRVQYFRQEFNKGSLRNFETAIRRSRGKYIHLLHGDDLVKPGFYDELLPLFDQFPDIGAAFTKCTNVDADGVESEPWDNSILREPGIIPDFLDMAAASPVLQPPSIIVKREMYERLGSFYGIHYGEDWEMWTRIAGSYPIAYSPKCLALYRTGQTSNITSKSISTGQNLLDITRAIDMAQANIPLAKRASLKRLARKNFSMHYAQASNWIYRDSKKAAFVQAHGALKMHVNLKSVYYVFKLYLMHLKQAFNK